MNSEKYVWTLSKYEPILKNKMDEEKTIISSVTGHLSSKTNIKYYSHKKSLIQRYFMESMK